MTFKKITLSNPTYMIIMSINMEILKINNRCSLEKEFIELVRMNP